MIGSTSPTGRGPRLLSYALFAIGLVTFAWGGMRSTNIAALANARPRPRLWKPRSNFNIAIVLGGCVLCIAAIVILIRQLSATI